MKYRTFPYSSKSFFVVVFCFSLYSSLVVGQNDWSFLPGTIHGDQVICEGELPKTLELNVNRVYSDIKYIWQRSVVENPYNWIDLQLTGLRVRLHFFSQGYRANPVYDFSNVDEPYQSTFYRVVAEDASGNREYSTVAEIKVYQQPEIVQTSASDKIQFVCPDTPIIDVVFETRGDVGELLASGLENSGLTFSGPVNGQYTLSGTPTEDVEVSLNTAPSNVSSPTVGQLICPDASYQYNIVIVKPALQPLSIRKGYDHPSFTIYQEGGRWINNGICNPSGISATKFFVEPDPNQEDFAQYEWQLLPADAGTINMNTGLVEWDNGFTGAATIRVRALTCGGDSDWTEAILEVTNSNVLNTSLNTPEIFLGPIPNNRYSVSPECEFTDDSDDSFRYTQFYVSSVGQSSYQYINWSIENISPEGSEKIPGIIDSFTGLIKWNTNFWGGLDIVATVVNCENTTSISSRLPLYIQKSDNTVPSLLVSSTAGIPDCPPESGQYSQFKSNLPVDWELQSSAVGRLEIVDDYTLNLHWKSGFFGTVELTAKAKESCSIGKESLIVTVPKPAVIGLISDNSKEIKSCQGGQIEPIQYRITGYANDASIEGLPSGITSEITKKHHSVLVNLDRLSGIILLEGTYRLNVLSRDYKVDVNRGEEVYLSNLLGDLLNLIVADQRAPFTASMETNSLLLTANQPGIELNVYFAYYDFSGRRHLGFSILETIQEPERILTLAGKAEAEPGIYNYTLRTERGGENCSQASIAGRITITGLSSSTLSPLSDDGQIICFGEPIADIKYIVENAFDATATGLPDGVSAFFDASTKVLTLSGTPSARVSQTTVYTYQINTQSNLNGCIPESTQSGTITIKPPQEIQLLSDIGSDEQTVCNSTNSLISPIIYQLQSGSNNYEISGIPQGVEVHFDPFSKKITITGRPSVITDETIIFNYSLTTSGNQCSPKTVMGTITVQALPRLELLSEKATLNQIEENAVCWNSSIIPIEFEIQNANSITISGLPEGVVTTQSGNRVTISGAPTAITSNTTRYNFILTPVDENCKGAESYSGLIEVIPLPKIEESFIQNSDVTHVSCYGHTDGSILIPETKPDFDLRIHGGQNPTLQKDHIILNNQPVLGDVYTVLINGISYSRTVISPSFGIVQTVSEITNELIAEINHREDLNFAPFKASFISPSTIELIASAPSISYTISATLATSYTGTLTPSVEVFNITSTSTSSYNYSWIGPNGFKSSDLSIENLEAGTYFLEVTYDKCVSEKASFTIKEPDPITIDTEVCKGILQTTITGGKEPYKIKLYDNSNRLLQTDYTTSVQNYSDLLPGTYYLLEVMDTQCSIPQRQSILIPYELTFDETVPLVVDDYCNDSMGDGFIELGGNSGGEAFSGGSNRFTYTWRGGPSGSFYANTRDIYKLEPGVYTVTVTDQELGCSENQSFTVGSVDEIVITPTTRTEFNANGKIEVLCAQDETAFIEITATGGLGNFTYSWLKNGVSLAGKTQPKLESLGIGNYTVIVNDAPPSGISASLNACQASYDFEVIAPEALTVIVNAGTSTQVICPGEENPRLEIEIQGGIPPFQVNLNKGQAGSFTVPNHERYTYSNLNLNETGLKYEIEVTDANGCSAGVSSQTTIRYEALQSVEFKGMVFPIDCIEGNLGRIELELIAGTLEDPDQVQLEWISPYSHLYHTWETNQGRLENIEFGGTYQAIITYKGCELYNESFRINEANESVYLSSVFIDGGGCNGETGSISLAIEGGNPPYTIEWQQYKTYIRLDPSISETVSSSTSSTSISGNPTTTQQDWVTLPQFANNAFLEGLNPGAYRAIVRDASASFDSDVCRPYVITDALIIGSSVFDISQPILRNEKSCSSSDTTAELQFSVINTLPNSKGIDYELEILLDTQTLGSNLLQLNENTYKITGIEVGSHLLEIKTRTSSQVVEDFDQCSILYNFEVETQQPLTYSGPREITLDPCGNLTSITILPSQISGGIPFVINSSLTYDFYWTFRPAEDGSSPFDTQQFVGDTISDAQAGIYELLIIDSLGCESEPILITVTRNENSLPFTVTGNLIDLNSEESDLVKSLAPTCTMQDDGQIGISIEGGVRPYSIFWYKEQVLPGTDTSSATAAYILLEEFSNTTSLSGLESGKYRVRIVSQNQSCDNLLERNKSLFYEEELIVPQNNNLALVSGPYIDENLCQLQAGKLILEVFDYQQENLTFYYNNEFIAFEEQNSNNENKIYSLFIENPIQEADLVITNTVGCQLIERLFLSEIGTPEFTYTTPSLEAEGVILAKEEIIFTNTSEPPFYYSEWNFGDGSPSQQIQTDGLSSPVRYSYGIAGTYYVTLRNYSRLGCYKEQSEALIIGRGYNIIAPNAFTPNGDSYNDIYRILFNGFERVDFKIYNDRGDLLHSETVRQLPGDTLASLELIGWDGQNETGSSFYTYSFSGILITDQTEITQSGNFVLIK